MSKEKKSLTSPERAMNELEPTLQVGKAGITPHLVEELKEQLEKRKVVKVKLQRAAKLSMSIDEAARQLSAGSGGSVVDVRGGCIVLKRR
ncbi:MAG: YhbY family RNA-binding protein [Methermicoccaceae archaeon]